jgi:exodeoxyribonuclease V alpha subunit
MPEAVEAAIDGDLFSAIDRQFARFMERLAGGEAASVKLAAALVSQRRGRGDICLDLAAVAETELKFGADGTLRCPTFATWEEELRASKLTGSPGEFTPLVLDPAGRLYLHRYWQYEQELADDIVARLRTPLLPVNAMRLRDGLKRLFPANESGSELDWQKVAAVAALRNNLCVICGGPGTGKTRTVVLLLALLLEQTPGAKPRIALVAPTGKAAARLAESIQAVKASLDCDESIKAALPTEARTIHRLLGVREGSPYFRHDAANPLAVDVVVVDEASMVDLALMAKLFAAIPQHARVILLGDKDQLASVEAGAVLGDLCLPSQVNHFTPEFAADFVGVTGDALPASSLTPSATNALVHLRRNFRFGAQSGLRRLSDAVNAGDADEAIKLLRELSASDGVNWRECPAPTRLRDALRDLVLAGYRACLEATESAKALRQLGRFRILGAVRHGPCGVPRLNRLAEDILAEARLIVREPSQPNYHGRPVLVTRNDYDLRLFNGDVGLLWSAESDDELRAVFPEGKEMVRALTPHRLPEHETVFAMTVHKSQGSEFERVLLVLPEADTPVLTRELLYTGLTRARAQVELWASEAAVRRAVSTPVRRASGLREAVWGGRTADTP